MSRSDKLTFPNLYATPRCPRGEKLTTGIKGSGLGDLKVFAQRWLASKKKANHPLLAGTPMCDEVHEILGQLTSI
jgi:hypothetical protein